MVANRNTPEYQPPGAVGFATCCSQRADFYGSFSLPWRSLLKMWPSAIHPHPAQATRLLSHKTNNVLQLWLAFPLRFIWANLSPSHAEQLAPSGLTCFLRTFWGLHQFSTNTAFCLCPEVSRSASCWGWGTGAIALHKMHLAPVFGLPGNPVQEANGAAEQKTWRYSPPWQHQLPSPDKADERAHGKIAYTKPGSVRCTYNCCDSPQGCDEGVRRGKRVEVAPVSLL